uniref:Uncharacterized protein n=1 Tax=Chromera velia CCMP2878 TaxID=1169474 RepID=A0A0G4GK11_9ALVE|eukprot:Cvel_22250.t1-p1 / transcript=Cvel_22250.t1 / gene=Cvel_22250 / organism=Chromera_velia_CCMP2878 / gene_product=hypothetical protein / transcript_product=hypothetical protein / location=Cvel_scaffold2168:146-877(-) / protein_length=244 / sequence_SO=supercontig / SO=protein_coding / is_pseudo=false
MALNGEEGAGDVLSPLKGLCTTIRSSQNSTLCTEFLLSSKWQPEKNGILLEVTDCINGVWQTLMTEETLHSLQKETGIQTQNVIQFVRLIRLALDKQKGGDVTFASSLSPSSSSSSGRSSVSGSLLLDYPVGSLVVSKRIRMDLASCPDSSPPGVFANRLNEVTIRAIRCIKETADGWKAAHDCEKARADDQETQVRRLRTQATRLSPAPPPPPPPPPRPRSGHVRPMWKPVKMRLRGREVKQM